MLEGWIYRKSTEGRRLEHTWTKNKSLAKDLKWYIEDGGRRLTCLSQLDSSRLEVKDHAYWHSALPDCLILSGGVLI